MGYVPVDTEEYEDWANTETTGGSAWSVVIALAIVALLVASFAWWLISRENFRSSHYLVYQCQPGHELVVRDGFGQHTPMCVGGNEAYWAERVWWER